MNVSGIIDYKIIGNDMQIVEIALDPGEGVRGEVGAMLYMTDGVDMQTSVGNGMFRGLKRMVTGESFCITTFLYNGCGNGHVAFGAPYPGKVLPLDLEGGSVLCQKDAFLCAAPGIDIEVASTTTIGTGLFGGEGLIFQRLTGNGLIFVYAGGTSIELALEPGEVLRVAPGSLVAFSPEIGYDIQFIGGFQNALFGEEGRFLARLTGRGCVYLQSLPFSRLADRIFATSRFRSIRSIRR
jgi:uncharacterized protein (TIGR00266 family)